MSINYAINHPCPVKETLGGDSEFLTICLYRELTRAAKRRARRKKLNYEEVTVSLSRITAEGIEEQEEPLVALLDRVKPLDDLMKHCDDCPACVLSEQFGCFDTLSWPISDEAEEWLHDRIPHELPEWVARGWRLFWKEGRADAALIGGLREKGREYLQAESAWTISVTSDKRPVSFNANELLAALFGAGKLAVDEGLMLLGMLGILDSDVDEEDEERPVIETEWGRFAFDLQPISVDDESTRNLKAYLFAVFFAALSEVDLQISL